MSRLTDEELSFLKASLGDDKEISLKEDGSYEITDVTPELDDETSEIVRRVPKLRRLSIYYWLGFIFLTIPSLAVGVTFLAIQRLKMQLGPEVFDLLVEEPAMREQTIAVAESAGMSWLAPTLVLYDNRGWIIAVSLGFFALVTIMFMLLEMRRVRAIKELMEEVDDEQGSED